MQETLNGEVAVLLRDLVDFLESLGELYLTDNLQDSRDGLVKRVRSILEQRTVESPEPYLDMSAGNKSLTISTDEIDRPQEYVNAEQKQEGQRVSLQHYYETFQDFQGDGKKKEDGKTDRNKEIDDVTVLFAGYSATQAKARSAKSGSLLHLRRKMSSPINVFLPNKQCWVCLVGSHLLLFTNDHESRPYLVKPLVGYKGRPAPGVFPRDPRRAEGAFEIYSPGEPTFQFVAKSAQEMKEWIEAITDCLDMMNGGRVKRAPTFMEILELESAERKCIEVVKEKKEKFQEALSYPKPKIKEKTPTPTKSVTPEKEKVEEPKEDAPPLPSRTRRLPSLPSEEGLSYEPREELYEEEGLYHKIEDIKAQRQYQNLRIRSKEKPDTDGLPQETYDDVETFVDNKKESNGDGPTETYDDVRNVVQGKNETDDAQTAAETSPTKERFLKSPKSLMKSSMSLFDKVRNPRSTRKESFKKEEKKPKSPTPTSPRSPEPELPCYDDVSNLTAREVVDEENYLTPPPPRPIYSRPPSTIKCAVPEEIYDDIGYGSEGCRGCANVDVIRDYPKNGSFLSDLQMSIESQHYQIPKSGNHRVIEQPEEIYDDVALSKSFKNRTRDATASPEKSYWGRLGSAKMPKILNHVSRQNSCS